MSVRRVITGRGSDGESIFVEDGLVEPLTPRLLRGSAMYQIWGSESPVDVPGVGMVPATFFPSTPAALRVICTTIPPDEARDLPAEDVSQALAEAEALMPGITAHTQEGGSDHATPTSDFLVVVAGRIDLHVGKEAPVTLGPGDVVVQHGTDHRWANPYDEACTFFVVMQGAPKAH
jgi:mannose-6-phosphate isomerase-like protein (cupin superfamily)